MTKLEIINKIEALIYEHAVDLRAADRVRAGTAAFSLLTEGIETRDGVAGRGALRSQGVDVFAKIVLDKNLSEFEVQVDAL